MAEFLDVVLADDQHDVSVQEIVIRPGSGLIGKTLMDLRREDGRRPLIIAIRLDAGLYHTNPAPGTVLEEDAVIIALGSGEELEHLRQTVNG